MNNNENRSAEAKRLIAEKRLEENDYRSAIFSDTEQLEQVEKQTFQEKKYEKKGR